ncbi:MAG: 4'-phosphopantetheinyl transferase superfamily protein [Oscillospiraceae bacterium]|jgi:4'-phosphopantetheinyl transferase|nr:4'-phosphopantetheinyl transferase superfamily protein [Oscillospiraceae bacterium]
MRYYFYKCSIDDIKKQRAFARCLFKCALEKETGITGVDYKKDERGKPYIPIANKNLHMSISHCKAGIACIISGFPVGIDIEEISRMNIKTARRICTTGELELLEKAEDKKDLLCRFWVLKEAYSKLTGQGISAGFGGIDTIEGEKSGKLYAKRKDGVYIGIAAKNVIDFSSISCYNMVINNK